jgi:hypothetical protein
MLARLGAAAATVGVAALLMGCGGGGGGHAALPAASAPSTSIAGSTGTTVTTTPTSSTTAPSTTTAAPSTTTLAPSTAAPSTTALAASSPSVASTENTICTLVFPTPPGPGMHCMVSNLKISAGTPEWAYGSIGFYNAENQLDSDIARVILNLSSHEVIGPTNVGFCGVGPTAGTPAPGYSAIPASVLAGFELTPCSSPTTTTLPPTTTKGFAPTLGSAAWGQALGSFAGISGFGQVAPAAISLGAVASSPHVSSISWSNWGAAQAMGQGQAIDGRGQTGPVSSWPLEPATVVAFDLGSCDGGPPAYQEVTWYFPKDGQTFDPTVATNACTGR